MKTCQDCHLTKPLSEFHKKGTEHHSQCKTCRCAAQRAYHWAHREQAQAYKAAHRERSNRLRREWARRLRLTALRAYGATCVCCGETEIGFLTIDHINGGGTKHRNQLGRGVATFHLWLRRNGYPPGFQVLCYNCNCARAFNPGGCPHQLALVDQR
jgi:hypothetical protein